MKNLKFSWEVWSEVQLRKEQEDESLRLATFDIERSRLFFASTANFIYTTQLPSPQTEGAWNKSSAPAATRLDLETGDVITCLDYLMEKEALVVGTLRGYLLLYSVDDDATEIVGQVEGGVACISPSPDGDLLAIMTGFGQIKVMNLDWNLLYEMSLDNSPKGVDIHGSAFSVDCFFEASITWRGDRTFFASLSKVHDSLSFHKKLKVWDRDSGALHSVSNPKSFMGSVIDWKSLDAKMKKWIQALKIVVRDLLSSENHLCKQILNGLRCYFNKTDSRMSLFQEGEYDAVIGDKTWRLRKLYFGFYLFPSY